VQTFLALVTAIVAAGTLIPALFVTWWLAGSDDEARNPVAPILGLGLLAAAVVSLVLAVRLDPEPENTTIAVMALPAVLLLVAGPFAGNRARGRARARDIIPGALVLSLTPVMALVTRAAG
jgi:hypothetical protein